MSNSTVDALSGARPEHRLNHRRPITRRVAFLLRRGLTGFGPNLAINLVDVNPDGLGVQLNAPVNIGDEVEIELASPGVSNPLKLVGEVRWCMPVGDGTFRAGIKLRHRLTHTDILDLTG